MFLVVQGGFCNGFVITGSFETYGDAARWLLLQDGDIIVMTESGVKPGTFILVSGGPINGFVVTGTFDSRAAVVGFSDWQYVPSARVMELICP